MTLNYLHLDVFTGRQFEGNPLAVFLDAEALDAPAMQTIAREMNFSESTFLLPAERPDTDIRMRIFTPGVELPMAGHPTIGTTFALAHTGMIAPGRDHFVFGLGVGPTRVELTWNGTTLAFASMDQRLPDVRQPVVPVDAIVRAAGVDPAAHRTTGLPIQEISCGVPYILLPLATRAAVDAAVADVTALRQLRSAFPAEHTGIYLFSTESADDDVTAYCRMFAPGLGVAEDPATGSACGPLGCYLVQQGLVPRGAAGQIISWQGVAMGRPSRIHIAITPDAAGGVSRVQVGGEAVIVAQGRLSGTKN
ncbi:MAG TPA: PhzF family phenazine biosynthesis protein [Vicinamibacterales bacterium]|nr:PhzF family phenazine biosynthesis protein [Vicinamibacterales bacterium]